MQSSRRFHAVRTAPLIRLAPALGDTIMMAAAEVAPVSADANSMVVHGVMQLPATPAMFV